MKNPVLTRPLQMFAIEFAAAFVMVLLVPGDKGTAIITTPLIAGAAAGIAGLGIGLYEKQLIAREFGSAGPVITGSKAKPKKKREEKKEEEAEVRPQPAMRAIGAQPAFGSQEQPSPAATSPAAQPGPAERTGPPSVPARPAPVVQTPASPSPPAQEPSPAVAGDKLPAWMEKAMAQARLSQESSASSEGVPSEEELTQEELRARLEQPVNLGMPVKAVSSEASQGPESIDELVGVGAAGPSAGTASQIDSLLGADPSVKGPAPPAESGRSIQAAVVHPDPDQRRHIASMLSGIGLSIVLETDSEDGALLGLLDTNADVIVTALDEISDNPAEYVTKLRKASQFALIVGYGDKSYESIREIAAVWLPGGPVPSDLARMLGI